ncbi:MAG TPA: protein translocase subunit SecD [Thermoanaerobaculia bacterium]|jgi:preprotein translocase subunit SecD|nr:protein translocase subunit SecD [Thermoanaerobaculia bacterium]
MKRPLLWRGILILAVTAVCIALAYPPKQKINLGLDLQGGMHLLLQVHTEDALRAETDSDMARLLDQAKEQGVSGITGRRTGDAAFAIAGASPDARDTVSDVARRYLPRWEISRRGDEMVFTLTKQATNEVRTGAVNQAVQTINNRINQFGVSEPVIQPTTTGNRIVVQLPGVDDPDRVRRLIKNTAFLEFRVVRFPKGGGGVGSREEILANFGGRLPPDLEILEGDRRDQSDAVIGKSYFAVEKRRTVTGRDLKNANPGRGQFGNPIVEFTLTPAGSVAFGELTGKNVGYGLAIVLDGRVHSAPVIKSRISDRGQIEGGFTEQEAQDLSTVLRSGALPASITYLEERTVGPSLGRDSIRDGLRAGVVGTLLVVFAMLIYYRLAGVNAIAALVLNIVILFGGMGAFHSTLTLPGIAGVILTIGMAVDANVLVFERIREELRAGRTVRSAIDLGFERAFTSIIDTHVTTMVSALFLFQFGTGPIKGFAVTLFIGLLASLFTAVFVSRWLFDLVLSRRRVQELSI